MSTGMISKDTDLKDLLTAGAHYGYSKSRRHPSAKEFILGSKNNIEIFDLEKTLPLLESAKGFVKNIVANGGQILFVGAKSEAKNAIKTGADLAEMPYVTNRWIGGTITNFPEIKKRVDRLQDLLGQREKGELSKYTKKERLLLDREIETLDKMFSGLVSMKKLPAAIFVIDPRREKTAVAEAKRKKIPVVALAGSDCDLKQVEFSIPANDASMASIKYFVEQIVEAIKIGRKQQKSE